ncbi:OmpH family outer membrane protein [Cyanobacterium aponinum]|uniref:Uncharacterized protein n=1 Tax=Cyanobacterium aponinum 0216 TaxID=2676140 RepID=A0A844GP09_9CHRO|nr:OmpH family outer membrane protein [Cyanobacterium aponinum]MTF38324.1 hypothetical protein [Cyanobacterium aponinum 0216]
MNRPDFSQKINAKAFERNTKPKPIINKQKNPVSQAELASSPWGKLTFFLDRALGDITPRSFGKKRQYSELAVIQIKCLEKLLNYKTNNWDDLLDELDELDDEEYNKAENFYYHLSRKYSIRPDKFITFWHQKISEFVDLFEKIVNSDQLDLIKLENFANIIDNFNRSRERSFWFLHQLPYYLDEKNKYFLLNSESYQTIIQFGASEYISKFGYQLQKEFNLTRTDIKEKAAQNLVQELGETENNLRAEISRLENENQELEREIQDIKENSLQEAVYTLAKSLQDEQQQPVLDQLFSLYKKIDKLLENNEGLSTQDTLTCFINLENLFKAFSTLNIQPFPPDTEAILEITGEDLDNNKYNYVSGSQFISKEEVKKVKCVACGWKVGEEIVTPAKVEEIEN